MNNNDTNDLETLDAQLFAAIKANDADNSTPLASAILKLRESSDAITDRTYASAPRRAQPAVSAWNRWIAVTCATAAIAVFTSTVALRSRVQQPLASAPAFDAVDAPVQPSVSQTSLSDEALLQTVQADLSDSVPDALAPLATSTPRQ